MKTRFEKLADLARATVSSVSEKYPGANEALSKAATSAMTVGKSAREAIETAVDKSGDLFREAGEHEYAKAATAKIRSVAQAPAVGLQRFASRGSNENKAATDDAPTTDSTKNIEVAIEKLKGADKVGRAGEVLGVAGGAVAGASAAGVVAGVAGTTTIFGSTALGTALGGTFVAATPIGWVIGTAVVAGAAGYGIVKMIRSGSQQDHVRSEIIERLQQRLAAVQAKSGEVGTLDDLRKSMPIALERGLLTPDQAKRMIDLVEKGVLASTIAVVRINGLIAQS